MIYRKERKVAAAVQSLMAQTRDSMVCFEFVEPVDPREPQDVIDMKLRNARIIEASGPFARYFGYKDRGEVIGAHLMDLFNNEIPDWFVNYGQEVEDGGFEDIERRIEIPVGDSWRAMRVYMQNIFDGPLLTNQWITLRDVTREERAERAMAEQEQLNLLALEAIGLENFVVNLREVAGSRRTEELVRGIQEEKHWQEIHSDDLPLLESACERFCAGEQKELHGLFRVSVDHQEVWLEAWAVASSRDALGLPESVVGVIMDRTSSKQIENKLIGNQRLESLGVLTGGITHDFNNLLMSIMGSLDLLMHRNPELSDLLGVIDDAATQAVQLCEQLLTYSGRGTGNLAITNVSDVLGSMRDLLAITAHQNARLDIDLADECFIRCDSSQIRQIALNLVKNSSDALVGNTGQISLTLRPINFEERWRSEYALGENLHPGEYVALTVSDDGAGVSLDELDKVFDPFYTTKFTGRGLGLAVVMGIVRGYNGAIKITSRVGEGTEVQVLFPIESNPDVLQSDQDAPKLAVLSGTILVVDDEAPVLQTVGNLLKEIGLDAELVPSGQAAINAVQQKTNQFAAILMDVTMPDLDGIETAAQILDYDPRAKIVLSSGYSNVVVPEKLKDRVQFLQKPYRLDVLHEMLGDIRTSGEKDQLRNVSDY
ncbi:MAG: response regulator [Pseudomonadales bacterium]|nr:response regulator [Pseudomonadales bacterium]